MSTREGRTVKERRILSAEGRLPTSLSKFDPLDRNFSLRGVATYSSGPLSPISG
jgi:hypothetical protein